jgi:hypothetical protein
MRAQGPATVAVKDHRDVVRHRGSVEAVPNAAPTSGRAGWEPCSTKAAPRYDVLAKVQPARFHEVELAVRRLPQHEAAPPEVRITRSPGRT